MTYYYLSEKPEIPYTVDAKPPPADEAEARLHAGGAEGRVLETWNLARQGQGKLAVSFAKATIDDSPLALVVAFRKGEGPKALHESAKPILLADPQPAKIKAPAQVKVGEEVELKVVAWAAVAHAGPGKTQELPERDTARIPKAAKDEVHWRVDGEEITATGETVKLTIEAKHVGKPIVVEAYRGAPTGRAKAELKGPKLASVEPAPAKADVKVFVNLAADEAKHQGRKVTVTATVTPPQAGVPVHFTLDKDLAHRVDKEHLDLSAASSASVSPAQAVTDKAGVAKATLTLSTYGGDRYRVSAALRKDVKPESPESLESGWFTVWRKIAFEVDRMQRVRGGRFGEDADLKSLIDGYAEQFLVLESTGKDNKPPFQWVLQKDEIQPWAQGVKDGRDDIPRFQVAFVNAIAVNPVVRSVTYECKASRWFDQLSALLYCFDPRDLVATATWAQGARTGTLDRNRVSIDYFEKPNVYELRIDLTSFEVEATEANPVRVTLGLKTLTELPGGQIGKVTMIGVRYCEQLTRLPKEQEAHKLKKSDLPNLYRYVLLHEAGHAFGLASKLTPEQPSRAEPAYYDVHPKHIGPHCKNNSEKCVMWGQIPDGSPTPHLELCERCQAALRARALDRLPANAKAAY